MPDRTMPDFAVAPEEPSLPVSIYTIVSDKTDVDGRWVTERMALHPDLPICHTVMRREPRDQRPYRMVFREHFVGSTYFGGCVEEVTTEWMVSCLGPHWDGLGDLGGCPVDDPIDFLLTGRVDADSVVDEVNTVAEEEP